MPQFKRNQLSDDIIDGDKVEDGTLTGDDIQNGSITEDDLSINSIAESKIAYADKTRSIFITPGACAPGPGSVELTTWGQGSVGFMAWAFSSGIVETVDFPITLPEDWKSNTDLTVVAYWAPSSTQNNKAIGVHIRSSHMKVGDVATSGSSTSTVALSMGAANTLASQSFTISSDAGWASGDIIYTRMYRDGNDGLDTYTADAYFIGANIKYTSDKRGS